MFRGIAELIGPGSPSTATDTRGRYLKGFGKGGNTFVRIMMMSSVRRSMMTRDQATATVRSRVTRAARNRMSAMFRTCRREMGIPLILTPMMRAAVHLVDEV